MNLKDYLNEIQDFDDASQRELLADFQNGNFLDFSEVMPQSTRSFQDFLNTSNSMPQPIRLGETVRGMNNVSPLLAVKFKIKNRKIYQINILLMLLKISIMILIP